MSKYENVRELYNMSDNRRLNSKLYESKPEGKKSYYITIMKTKVIITINSIMTSV